MKRLLVIFLIVALALSGCVKEEPTATEPEVAQWQEQFDLGIRFLDEGEYEKAILAFTAVIEIDPNNVDPYFKRAEAYQMGAKKLSNMGAEHDAKTKEYLDNARKDYEKVAELDPERTEEVEEKQKEIQQFVEELENRTFFEKNNIELSEVEDRGMEIGFLTLGYSDSGYDQNLSFDYVPVFISNKAPVTVKRSYGNAENPNKLEYTDLDVWVTTGSCVMSSETQLQEVADFLWYHGNEWENYGLTQDDVEEFSDKTEEAYQAFCNEFLASSGKYKVISGKMSLNAGVFEKDVSEDEDNSAQMNVTFAFGAVDKYTGFTLITGIGDADSVADYEGTQTITVGEQEIPIRYVVSSTTQALHKDTGLTPEEHYSQYPGEFDYWNFEFYVKETIMVLVPAEYDGMTFFVGPVDEEIDAKDDGFDLFVNFTDLPQFGNPGNYFFAP